MEAFDVVYVLHRKPLAREGPLDGWDEVEPGGYTDGLGGCAGDLCGQDLEAATSIGDRAVDERLIFVVVQTEGCRSKE